MKLKNLKLTEDFKYVSYFKPPTEEEFKYIQDKVIQEIDSVVSYPNANIRLSRGLECPYSLNVYLLNVPDDREYDIYNEIYDKLDSGDSYFSRYVVSLFIYNTEDSKNYI